jgi:hypothetical protein
MSEEAGGRRQEAGEVRRASPIAEDLRGSE